MSITNFCLLNETEGKLLSRKLHDAVRRWQLDWLRPSVSWTLALVQAADVETRTYRWTRGTASHALAVAVGVPRSARWGLGTALMDVVEAGGEQSGDIGRDVEIEVLRGLAQTLLAETGRVSAGEPIDWSDEEVQHSFDSNSGFAAAECRLLGSGAPVALVLYPATTGAYLAELPRETRMRGGLVPARRAIESQALRLDVVLGETELLLPEMATLAVGDVLRLDCNLAQPLQVVLPEGGILSRAHLGVAGDRKAVQLSFVQDRGEL